MLARSLWPFEGENEESIRKRRSELRKSMGTGEVVRAMSQSEVRDNGEEKDRKNGVVSEGDVWLECCSRVACPDGSVLVSDYGVGGDAGAGSACHRSKMRGCKAGQDNDVLCAAEAMVGDSVPRVTRGREIFQGRIVGEKP